MGESDIEDLLFQRLKSGSISKKTKNEEEVPVKLKHTEPKKKKTPSNKKTKAPSLSDILGTAESSTYKNQYDAQDTSYNYNNQKDGRSLEIIHDTNDIDMIFETENKGNFYQSTDTQEQLASHYGTHTQSPSEEDTERIIEFKTSFRFHELLYFVADTNFLIDNLAVIEMMDKIETHFSNKNRSFLKICVVDTVLSELDHLKQPKRRSFGAETSIDSKTQDLKMKAIKANRYIYDKITTNDTDAFAKHKVFQVISRTNLKKDIKKYSKQLKVAYDFQEDYNENNDDKILDSCLKLQEVLEFQHDLNSDFEFIKVADFIKYSLLPTSSVVVLTNDKNFCIKLISSSLRTISLPPEENRSDKELLINTKVLILKCLQEQIKNLVVNWQNMIILNLFETFLLDSNLNKKMIDAYNYLLNETNNTAVTDIKYLKETSHLFSLNNISKSGIDELLDDAPDLELIFCILNKAVVSFQSASCQTMTFLGVSNIDYNKALELVNMLFFNDTEALLDKFIEKLIELVKRDYEKEKIAAEIDLLLNFNGYLINMNNMSECWKLYLTSLADGVESVFISNFKLKLDVMWKDVVDLLSDLLFLSELSIKDFEL